MEPSRAHVLDPHRAGADAKRLHHGSQGRPTAPVGTLSSWPATPEELVAEQERLGISSPAPWTPAGPVAVVGGCFVCFRRGITGRGSAGEMAWAAASWGRGRRVSEVVVVRARSGRAYEPGLLALREGPALEAAVRALPETPEVLLVNATGRDHPRRAGLALHLGALLDLPSVGVTHRTLVAEGEWPANERGASSPLLVAEEIVGAWLRTRPGARPVAVHAGWRTDVDTAVGVVISACRRARTPEPLRRARRAARLARAGLIHPLPP